MECILLFIYYDDCIYGILSYFLVMHVYHSLKDVTLNFLFTNACDYRICQSKI